MPCNPSGKNPELLAPNLKRELDAYTYVDEDVPMTEAEVLNMVTVGRADPIGPTTELSKTATVYRKLYEELKTEHRELIAENERLSIKGIAAALMVQQLQEENELLRTTLRAQLTESPFNPKPA